MIALSPTIQFQTTADDQMLAPTWYADGNGGFGLNQTLPYISNRVDRQVGTGNSGINTYYDWRSSFIATSIAQNGSSIEVQGATLADLATLTFANGFGETVTGTAGAATTVGVHVQNRVFSFWIPQPVTVEVYTAAALVDGVLTTTRDNVTFYPAEWLRYWNGSVWVYRYELIAPNISTVPNVAAYSDGLFGIHNADYFGAGIVSSDPLRAEVTIGQFPILDYHRPQYPAGSTMRGQKFGLHTGTAQVVCGESAAYIAGAIQYLPPSFNPWGPAHAEILFQ